MTLQIPEMVNNGDNKKELTGVLETQF